MYKQVEKEQSKSGFENVTDVIQNTTQKSAAGRLIDNRSKTSALENASPVQRTLDDDFLAITQDMNATQDPLLKKLLQEALLTSQRPNVNSVYGPSDQQSHAQPTGQHGVNRGADIVIDQTHYTNAQERQSIILHELLHASADTKYAINQQHGQSSLNSVLRGNNEGEEIEFASQQFQYAAKLANELKVQAEKERGKLGDDMTDHVIDRANRIIGANTQEFDTVSSELLYFMRMRGVDDKTKTFRKVSNMAEAAYNARNNDVPLTEGYLEPDSFKEFAIKSACFLTTACAYAHGLSDDCEELTTLRALRDGYMRQREEDEALIKRYYEIAPVILDNILMHVERVIILRSLYETICRCVELVKEQRPDKAVEMYRDMIKKLQFEYAPELNSRD